MKNKTTLEIAEAAFAEAIAGSYPADLIARLYADLQAARKAAQKKNRR